MGVLSEPCGSGNVRKEPWELGVGKMAQPVKYLLCNHESLDVSLEMALKGRALWHTLVFLVPWKWRQEDSCVSLARRASQISGFQVDL